MLKIFYKISFIVLCTSAAMGAEKASSDTIAISIEEIEKIFFKNNLEVLAGKYSIDEAKALIRQSKLWDNPNIYLEQNIYNTNNSKFFDATKTGENIVQLQQLFHLAGQRNKKIKLAQINARLTEYQFYDLLRTLKFELHTVFYDIYFTNKIIKMYDRELLTIRKNVAVFDTLNDKGVVSLKESVRLKAFQYTLENERLEFSKSLISNRQTLSILLNDTAMGYLEPLVPIDFPSTSNIGSYNLPALQDSAATRRFDLKSYQEQVNYEKVNLKYQQALVIPDFKLGGVYDRQGNFISNYTALSLQMDLPVWNRNQGNIAASRIRVKKVSTLSDMYTLQVNSEVKDAYLRSLENINLYNNFDKKFTTQFNFLTDGVTRNYQKRNITILEFIDFFESYKAAMIQIHRLTQSVINGLEELNYVTGTNLLKY